MQIHVVQPGQSIFSIAQGYSTTVSEIVQANKLPNPNNLVVGQALVIPITGSFYWVSPGDSLYSIGNKVGVSYQEIARVNRISPTQQLTLGQRLYIPPKPKRNAEFNGYVEPRGEVSQSLEQNIRSVSPRLTYLAPFSFQIGRDGSLKEPVLNNFPAIAREHRVTLMMVVTNLENDQFSDELGRIILNDQNIQNSLLNNIVQTAKKYGFRDIHFDMEYLRPVDRQAYLQFLQKARNRFKQEGWLLSAALAPKTGAMQKGKWYEAHDYRGIGQIVDFVVIMTYEWGYSGGPPMAVSPIGPVREVLEYALTEMPGSKIMMGQNLYGYDWTLPYVPGGQYAKAVSPQRAIQLASEHNVPISYDYKAQAPHFNYTDNQGKQHTVWFEDARSIQEKFNLVKELNLRGVSYWKLGIEFPQNWLLIDDNFTVEKK